MLQVFKRFTQWLKRLIMPSKGNKTHSAYNSHNSNNKMYDLSSIYSGPSPMEYGLYLLRSGKHRSNNRKRKIRARQFA